MSEAKVAVLLITTGFLSSKYIWDKEVPRIQQHQKQGMEILPLITKPCAWRLEEWLAEMQVCPREGRPLSTGNEVQVDLDLMAFAYDLAERVQGNHSRLAAEERAWAEQLRMAASVQPLPGTRILIDTADSSQPSTSRALQIPANMIEGDLPQTWKGVYHPDSQFSLIISTLRDGKLEGEIHYSGGQTITRVEGSFEKDLETLAANPRWSFISSNTNLSNAQLALRFKETGYRIRGNRTIHFYGEYRAFVHGNLMVGAWFSEHSPEREVGRFVLGRQVDTPERTEGIQANHTRLAPNEARDLRNGGNFVK